MTVGHNAILHGCHIEDEVLIGMGAIILNGAHIGSHSIIGAGALVTEHMQIHKNLSLIHISKCIRDRVTIDDFSAHISEQP